SAVSPNLSPAERLMRADGTAGQWVIEIFSVTATPITEGDRSGFDYDMRQLLVTSEVVAITEPAGRCALTVPLHRCPLPRDVREAYENARLLAIQSVPLEFESLSVALARPPGEAEWHFRFYDM